MRIIVWIVSTLICLSCKTREEKIAEAKEEGKFLVEEKASYAKGVGDALNKDGKGAAEKVSEGVSEVFKGLKKGFDKSFKKVSVKTNPEIAKLFTVGRAGRDSEDSTARRDIVLYIIFVANCEKKFTLKAFDDDDTEIGRAKQVIKGYAEETGYATFTFDERVPLGLADYYSLELVQ